MSMNFSDSDTQIPHKILSIFSLSPKIWNEKKNSVRLLKLKNLSVYLFWFWLGSLSGVTLCVTNKLKWKYMKIHWSVYNYVRFLLWHIRWRFICVNLYSRNVESNRFMFKLSIISTIPSDCLTLANGITAVRLPTWQYWNCDTHARDNNIVLCCACEIHHTTPHTVIRIHTVTHSLRSNFNKIVKMSVNTVVHNGY